MNCEFCKKEFSNKSNMIAHQKTVKYCLEIQGKEVLYFPCEFCEKKFTSRQNQVEHFCKEKSRIDEFKAKSDYEECIKNQYDIKYKEFDQKISILNDHILNLETQLREKINEKNDYISKLEAKLEKFEDAVIASKKPATTTNNNNTNIVMANTLNLNDTERFKTIIEEKLTKNVVCNGQRGLAKFAVENLLKDSEGKLMYKCVDPSRHNFEFTNSDGIVEKDVKAIKLKRALIGGDVIVKAKNAGNELWTREDGSMDNDRYTASSGKVMEIMTVDRDDTKFRTELSALTS